jgi:mRNA interferase RelE/StbE
MKVELERQVVRFVRTLPPEPRRTLRRALRGLEREAGDIRVLEGELSGFYRLRIGRYRVIFYYVWRGKARVIRCIYANDRRLIYEVFAHHFYRMLEK